MVDFLSADWPAPAHVHSIITTRAGGVSLAPYDSFNVATHVEDNPSAVQKNRAILRQHLPTEPVWLEQIHKTSVINAGAAKGTPVADASFSHQADTVCTVMSADCLPVLFSTINGDAVAAAHAGWRGLQAGILARTAATVSERPHEILAWLGPAIGPESFEVGAEVYAAFVADNVASKAAFRPHGEGKFLADIYQLARLHLEAAGVTQVFGGGLDTLTDTRFFSYRQAAQTGRMASLIWFTDKA